jgi:hypothetical protein
VRTSPLLTPTRVGDVLVWCITNPDTWVRGLRRIVRLRPDHPHEEERMEDQQLMGTASGTSTAVRGTCDECGQTDILTGRVDPEAPLSDTRRLCPTCAQSPEPFWHDDR